MNKRDIKFFKFLILLLFFVVSNLAYGQDYNTLFDKGDRALNKKHFEKAVECFSQVIEIRNTEKAHFKRGYARFKLEDKEGFRSDMEQAMYLLNKIAPKMLDKYCYRIDTIERSSNHLILERIRDTEAPKDIIIYSNNFLDTIIYSSINNQRIYSQIKRKPKYSGGEAGFQKFIAKNVEYPRQAMINGIQGTVIASVVIDKDGKVSKIKILSDRHPFLNAASIKVIQKLDKFTPAYSDEGIPVAYKMVIPISFIMQ